MKRFLLSLVCFLSVGHICLFANVQYYLSAAPNSILVNNTNTEQGKYIAGDESTNKGKIVIYPLGTNNPTPTQGRYYFLALPAPGYEFSQWNDGKSENPRIVDLKDSYWNTYFGENETYELTASFTKRDCTSLEIEKTTCAGSISIAKATDAADDCDCKYTITATPSDGFGLMDWSDGVKEAIRTVDLNQVDNQTFVARFVKNTCTNFNTTVNDIITGTAGKINITKAANTCDYTLAAVANEGYHFVQWSDGAPSEEVPTGEGTYYTRVVKTSDALNYQALFQKDPIDVIYWVGGVTGQETNWDIRGNWRYIDKNGTVQNLTCDQPLAESLKAIIPAATNSKYKTDLGIEGVTYFPIIPTEVDENGVRTPNHLYADQIYIEYGGGLKGVENLTQQDKKKYNKGVMDMVASRKEWILVGTVIQPFENGESGNVRNVISGDYYIAEQKPHVYMHQAYLDGSNNVQWGTSFPNLDVTVNCDQVFAIQVPDMYGPYKLPANMYYNYMENNPSMQDDGDAPKTFTFTGRFYNDQQYTTYYGLKPGQPNLICNTYPCNIDPNKVPDGTVQVFNYKPENDAKTSASGSFGEANGNHIKPQHGFVYTPNEGITTLTITADMLVDGNTRFRSAAASNPYCYVAVNNAQSATHEGSYVKVTYNTEANYHSFDLNHDAPKVFVATTTVPDLYIEQFDKKWASLHVPQAESYLPLGVEVKSDMPLTFSVMDAQGYERILLEDKATGMQYDLLQGKVQLSNLPAGTYENRFYLFTQVAYSEDEDIPTDITDVAIAKGIQASLHNSLVTASAIGGETLKEAQISNLTGVTTTVALSGQYQQFALPQVAGVYIVRLLGEETQYTFKAIVK